MFSNRAAAAAVGGPDAVSDSSWLTDLQIVRRFLTAITNNLIFDCLTFIERMKAGTFHGGDIHEYISAAALALNESIALRKVEPIDNTFSHHRFL